MVGVRGFAAIAMVAALGACSADGSGAPTSSAPTTSTPSTQPTLDLSTAGHEVLTTALQIPRELVPLGEDRALLTDQAGVVHVLEGDTLRAAPFLDVRSRIVAPGRATRETGLAGFALAPDFASTGHVYTFTTDKPAAADGPDTVRVDTIARWTADRGTLVVDPASRVELLRFPRAFATHVGGEIVFDDAGVLWTAFGSNDNDERARDPQLLDGKVIRIDPRRAEGGRRYAIPADNPFAGGGGRPEVWSIGYRNPWRLAVHPEHSVLVGSAMWTTKPQQINAPQAGDDAGYPVLKSPCWVDGTVSAECQASPDGTPFATPVLEYGIAVGEILSGVAPVVSGPLAGRVVVADWEGALLAATPGTPPWPAETINLSVAAYDGAGYLWDLDVDDRGRLYLMVTSNDSDAGQVIRITPQ